mgnify:CR=1 FL=1
MANFSNSESVERLSLTNQDYYVDSIGKEMAVILLSGEFCVNEKVFTRKNVFESEVAGFYIANQNTCKITINEYAEFCIVQAASDIKVNFSIIENTQIKTKQAGAGNFERTVKTFIDNSIGFKNLIIGETTKDAGNWSSWPPHKHDTIVTDMQSKQKEIYLYKFSEPNGFGVQLIYNTDLTDADINIVRNNSEIKIEKGYHPVVAAPASSMYYLWCLFGDNAFFKVHTDLDYGN